MSDNKILVTGDIPILGVASRSWTREQLVGTAREAIEGQVDAVDEEVFERLVSNVTPSDGRLVCMISTSAQLEPARTCRRFMR